MAMNRKKWLSIKLILLLLIFFVVSVGAFNYVSPKSQTITDREEKLFTDVEKIVVESVSLSVNIYESDVQKVTIKDNSKTYGLSNKTDNIIEEKDGVVLVKQGRNVSFLSFVTGEFTIEVPKGSSIEYDINSISGKIDHNALSKDALRITSISGAVRIHQGSKKILVETTSGSVKIYEPFQELNISAVSGSIHIIADQYTKQIITSTISGSTSIQLQNVSGYEMDYSTTSGNIQDTYQEQNYSKTGSLRIGDPSLRIDSSSTSGSIRLEDWKN